MPNRSGKFYRKNEREVMERLGFTPTKNSGSGWIEKEDGQNDQAICQLKSTDAQSIRVHRNDLQTLEHNATVSHKVPVFAIQFIGSDEVYLLLKPEYIQDIADCVKDSPICAAIGHGRQMADVLVEATMSSNLKCDDAIIASDASARRCFAEEQDKVWKKERRSAT